MYQHRGRFSVHGAGRGRWGLRGPKPRGRGFHPLHPDSANGRTPANSGFRLFVPVRGGRIMEINPEGGARNGRGGRVAGKSPEGGAEKNGGWAAGKSPEGGAEKKRGTGCGKKPRGRRKKRRGDGLRKNALLGENGNRLQTWFGGCGILNASKGRATKSRGR